MAMTPNLNIELLSVGQSQPEVVINEAVMALDAATAAAQTAAAAALAAADEAVILALALG